MSDKEPIIDTEAIFFELPKNRSAAIKVIGVGGGGSNAVAHMYDQGITGVNFVICNTDAQALNNNPVPVKIQLGASITEGLGAGADPEVGEKAALESLEEIKNLLDANTKMVFITAGMGGGTGTGAAPILSSISKEKGILTVGIVTLPFYFEGKMRLEQAQKGIEVLRKNVDSLIVINNDKLRELYGNLGFKSGFAKADEVLTTAAKGIAEVITHHYKQNIDLRDARTVLKGSGTAIMGAAIASGENRAKEAVENALDSPLLNDNKITGAKNVLLLIISGNIEITIDEIGIISDHIQSEARSNTNIIMGIGEDESLEEGISVTIVATGFPTEMQRNISHEEKKIFYNLEEDYDHLSKKEFLSKDFEKYQNSSQEEPLENISSLDEEAKNWKIIDLEENSSQKEPKKSQNIQLIIDGLDDNKESVKKIEEEPIPDSLKKKIEERKKSNNSNFYLDYFIENSGENNEIPAYKRQKIELDETTSQIKKTVKNFDKKEDN